MTDRTVSLANEEDHTLTNVTRAMAMWVHLLLLLQRMQVTVTM